MRAVDVHMGRRGGCLTFEADLTMAE